MLDWRSQAHPHLFTSAELPVRWREALLPALEAAHRREPFSPRDPREGLRRATTLAQAVGLEAIMIRGGLATRGVEVDHVWLAVGTADAGPWVLDPSFPLHHRAFLDLLGGYVAGDLTIEQLVRAADVAAFADRVVGAFPPEATYRGEPVWSLVRS